MLKKRIFILGWFLAYFCSLAPVFADPQVNNPVDPEESYPGAPQPPQSAQTIQTFPTIPSATIPVAVIPNTGSAISGLGSAPIASTFKGWGNNTSGWDRGLHSSWYWYMNEKGSDQKGADKK